MNISSADALATALMQQHNLPREWSFAFDRSKVRLGKCGYRHRRPDWLALDGQLQCLRRPK